MTQMRASGSLDTPGTHSQLLPDRNAIRGDNWTTHRAADHSRKSSWTAQLPPRLQNIMDDAFFQGFQEACLWSHRYFLCPKQEGELTVLHLVSLDLPPQNEVRGEGRICGNSSTSLSKAWRLTTLIKTANPSESPWKGSHDWRNSMVHSRMDTGLLEPHHLPKETPALD